MADALGILVLLIGLELVLGVDNILVISIFVGRLEKSRQNRARILGLAFAFIARILMLIAILALTNLKEDIIAGFSIRDLILIAGGFFLLYKAVREIHATVELKDEENSGPVKSDGGYISVISQIVLLDVVFSIDSVITAVGLTHHLWVIISAVIISFIVILAFARRIGDFIMEHTALKILALSFLITIGVTIFMEGMHKEVPKAYIYLPMGFALAVELLQMRYSANLASRKNKLNA
jgi:predicted tellurium resistance membrane protein TerC